VPQLNIVNVSLPPEVEKAIDTRSSMGVIGDMQRYTQYQVATSMPMAAANPSGGFSQAGLGLGLGAAAGATLSQQMAPSAMPPPPPQPQATLFHLALNGQTVGPYAGAQLAQAVSQGQLTSATLVWAHGMNGWVPAGTVPALAYLFSAPPPPPPPKA
jgi:membrane protease subunit (stomatin/prohibitin family)